MWIHSEAIGTIAESRQLALIKINYAGPAESRHLACSCAL